MNEVLGDGWTATMSYQEAVAEVAKKAGGSNTKLKEMLGRIEGVNAVLGLTGKNAQTAAEDLDAMNNSFGAANKALFEQSKSVEIRWNKFVGTITAGATSVAQSLGDMFLPMVEVGRAAGDVAREIGIERAALNTLVTAINLTNDNQKLRNKYISELQEKYPYFLENIKTEEINYKNLKERLDDVNEAFKAKILLKISEAEVARDIQAIFEADIKQQDALTKSISEFNKLGYSLDGVDNINEGLDIMYAVTQQNKLAFSDLAVALQEYDDATKSLNNAEKDQIENQGKINKVLEKYASLLDIFKGKKKVKVDVDLDVTVDPEKLKAASEKSLKIYEDYHKKLDSMVESFRDKKADQADTELISEQRRIDLLFQVGKLSNEQYQIILSERLQFAKDFYGEDTEEYLRALEDKNRLEEENAGKTQALLKSVFDTSINNFDNFAERLKQKMLQLLLDNIFQIFLNFFSFGFGKAPILTKDLLLKGTLFSSFAGGTSNFSGGIAKVHKDELVTNLPKGSNVFTKTETAGILDMKPLIREIQLLRSDVKVLQSSQVILRGDTLIQMFNKQNKRRLSSN